MTADTLMILDVTLGSSELKRSGEFYDGVSCWRNMWTAW